MRNMNKAALKLLFKSHGADNMYRLWVIWDRVKGIYYAAESITYSGQIISNMSEMITIYDIFKRGRELTNRTITITIRVL